MVGKRVTVGVVVGVEVSVAVVDGLGRKVQLGRGVRLGVGVMEGVTDGVAVLLAVDVGFSASNSSGRGALNNRTTQKPSTSMMIIRASNTMGSPRLGRTGLFSLIPSKLTYLRQLIAGLPDCI